MVLDVPVKEGNSVIERNNFNEGTTIATIADMTDLIFQGKVDESEVGKVKLGMPVVLTVGAMAENAKWDAELEYIAPKGVEENRRHPVRDPRGREAQGRTEPAQRIQCQCRHRAGEAR
jgi:HlyD family secretion protein